MTAPLSAAFWFTASVLLFAHTVWAAALPRPLGLPLTSPSALNAAPEFWESPGVLTRCTEIRDGGRYRLAHDLVADPGQVCLQIRHVQNVKIDCQGRSILSMGAPSAVLVDSAESVSLQNCVMRDVGTIGLRLSNVRKAVIRRNTIHGMNVDSPSGGRSRELTIADNTFFEYYQQFHTQHAKLINNRFEMSAESAGAAAVLSEDGQDNEISGNEIDGGWTPGSKPKSGPHSGVLLVRESGTLLRNNQIRHTWDCGIQTAGLIQRVQILDNTIRQSELCGIGGWDWNSWRHNEVTGNRFDAVGAMFLFGRRYGLRSGETAVYFQDNQFVGNQSVSYAMTDPAISTAEFDLDRLERADRHGRPLSRFDLIAGQNVFRENDFGTVLAAPRLTRRLAIDGGKNICRASPDPAYPLECGRAPRDEGTVVANVAEGPGIRAYPNPWRSNRDANVPLRFDGLPSPCTIKIFTLSGRWLQTMESTGGQARWDLANHAGEAVASGHYFYLVTSPNGPKHTGRLAIIR